MPISTDRLVSAVQDFGCVHLIGIGGAGMSVVARLLKARGVDVQGSDSRQSATTDALAAEGIQCWIGHDGSQVRNVDTLVVSSAVRPDNPEVVAARSAGVRVLHRSQALAALMAGTRGVAVAGAHGKTTTSAMTAVVLRESGLDPSFAIGGSVLTAEGALSGGHLGSGDVLVAEADESDGSFLNYAPFISVVTNIEPDHLDHYGSAEAFQEAFVDFASRLQSGGWLVVCADDADARRLGEAHRSTGGNVLLYGTSADSDVQLSNYAATDTGGSSGTVTLSTHLQLALGAAAEWSGGSQGLKFELLVPGIFNAVNALAALGVALVLGVSPQLAVASAAKFRGTGRRFEHRGEIRGVRVVDDYAHHPTEVAALLTAARPVADGGRVLVLFQPHLFSRTRLFAQEFAQALDSADLTVVTDVFAAREDPETGVSGASIVNHMNGAAVEIADLDEAAVWLAGQARPGDLLLTVGAGDVTGAVPTVLAALARGRE